MKSSTLYRIVAVGACCLSGGLVWGAICAALARHLFQLSEESALIFVGLPVLVLVVWLYWKPVERALHLNKS